jgi:hypothetical protein
LQPLLQGTSGISDTKQVLTLQARAIEGLPFSSWRVVMVLPESTGDEAHDGKGPVEVAATVEPINTRGCVSTGKPNFDYAQIHGFSFWLEVTPRTTEELLAICGWALLEQPVPQPANLLVAYPASVLAAPEPSEPTLVISEADVRAKVEPMVTVVPSGETKLPFIITTATTVPYAGGKPTAHIFPDHQAVRVADSQYLGRLPLLSWPACPYCGKDLSADYYICRCLVISCSTCRAEARGCPNVICAESPIGY